MSLALSGYSYVIASDQSLGAHSAGSSYSYGSSSNYNPGTLSSLFGLIGFAILLSIAVVVLVRSDYKELELRGVPFPFGWLYVFLPYGLTIYIIGRSVVARRRTGSGLAPIWIYIFIVVGGTVVSLAATIAGIFARSGG